MRKLPRKRLCSFDAERAAFLTVPHQLMLSGSDRSCEKLRRGYTIWGLFASKRLWPAGERGLQAGAVFPGGRHQPVSGSLQPFTAGLRIYSSHWEHCLETMLSSHAVKQSFNAFDGPRPICFVVSCRIRHRLRPLPIRQAMNSITTTSERSAATPSTVPLRDTTSSRWRSGLWSTRLRFRG